jgi:N-acetylmuramoyl-L-alanine amidase
MSFRQMFLFCGLLLSVSSVAEKADIVIDAGHGGSDSGGKTLFKGKEILEKDITLDLALRVRAQLEAAGVSVFMTREDDHHVSFQERVELLEAHCRYFALSLHADSTNSRTTRGMSLHASAFDPYPEDDSFLRYSWERAEQLHDLLDIAIPLGGAKFTILRNESCPTFFLDVGFISNDEDLARLTSENGRRDTANHIAKAIITLWKSEKEKK